MGWLQQDRAIAARAFTAVEPSIDQNGLLLIPDDPNEIVHIVGDIMGGIEDKRLTTCAYLILGVFDGVDFVMVWISHTGSPSKIGT